ncbi:NUDIX domain-containing protein [Fictibacillus phosphorivorans]|uniref:NUDIX domain-containing protein n=1 Tax=Fictibacillus phosphorivorans TaxID=1221500 RepID=UPI0020401374|nr:NUDIX hydrolase [Fictibacillus phosphorivorans]MCM3718757.1 NUDIX hydrolase [Fictibacillus phosphorivorans]MCM3776380.1 NUDIX hydrolase [Fictibacillus phosphorivorans]
MNKKDRGKVWLAAAGLLIDEDGKWLVVKKKYGGLKGKWSIPAGFVDAGETVDEAAVREVFEETGILGEVVSVIGIRSGVIKETISDNMIVFLLKKKSGAIFPAESEIESAAFLTPEELQKDPTTSLMVHYFMNETNKHIEDKMNPGSLFGYTTYKIFDCR